MEIASPEWRNKTIRLIIISKFFLYTVRMYLVAIKTRKVFKVIIFTKKQTSFVGNKMYVHGNYKCLGMELFSSRRWRLDRPKQKAVVFMLNQKN